MSGSQVGCGFQGPRHSVRVWVAKSGRLFGCDFGSFRYPSSGLQNVGSNLMVPSRPFPFLDWCPQEAMPGVKDMQTVEMGKSVFRACAIMPWSDIMQMM